jgi:hypothetical protein
MRHQYILDHNQLVNKTFVDCQTLAEPSKTQLIGDTGYHHLLLTKFLTCSTYERWAHKHVPQQLPLPRATALFAQQVSLAEPLPQSHSNPLVTGPRSDNRTPLAEVCDKARTLWIIGQGAETATAAMEQLGIHPLLLKASEEDNFWQENTMPQI